MKVEQLHLGSVRCEIFVSLVLNNEKRIPCLNHCLFTWEMEEIGEL